MKRFMFLHFYLVCSAPPLRKHFHGCYRAATHIFFCAIQYSKVQTEGTLTLQHGSLLTSSRRYSCQRAKSPTASVIPTGIFLLSGYFVLMDKTKENIGFIYSIFRKQHRALCLGGRWFCNCQNLQLPLATDAKYKYKK